MEALSCLQYRVRLTTELSRLHKRSASEVQDSGPVDGENFLAVLIIEKM
jgi:hypothetical protein